MDRSAISEGKIDAEDSIAPRMVVRVNGRQNSFESHPPVISFFTGGGFFDLGFEEAGYRIAWTNEFNKIFVQLHDHAYSGWRKSIDPAAPAARISNSKSVTRIHVDEVLEQAFGSQSSRPDVFGVIGGPPCTDFSIGGLQIGSGGNAGKLTGCYVAKLLKLQPAFFVLENVPGLVRNAKHLRYFKKKMRLLAVDYHLHQKILEALEFGVPQDRERLFVVGIKRDLDPLKAGTPFEWPTDARLARAKLLEWPGENAFKKRVVKPAGLLDELMVYTALGGAEGVEHLPNGKEWFVPYSKKFTRVPEGRVNTKSFKRLHRYRYSPTAWYGNNEVHLHPTEARRISVREALRLQSVPDTYVFPVDAPLNAKFKIICNGVPVKLAEAVAGAVRRHLVKLQIMS